MKLFGKKINLGKTLKNVGSAIVKGAGAVVKTVAPVIKTVFPASAGVVDKVTGFIGKASDKIKSAQNVIKTNSSLSGIFDQIEDSPQFQSNFGTNVSTWNSVRGGSNNLVVQNRASTSDTDPQDKPEIQFALSPFMKLILLVGGGYYLMNSK